MLFGCLGVTACGGTPSATDICKHSCEKQASCQMVSDQLRKSCEDLCPDATTRDDVQTIRDSCKNADELISEGDDCVQKYCSQAEVNSCITAVAAKCEAK